jgi:DNA polymerase-3 subunit delta
VTPDQALNEAHERRLRPVYLVIGEEPFLRARVVAALREAALHGAVPGLNDDELRAGETTPEVVLAAARTVPMMAARRLVVVHDLERWEGREAASASGTAPLDRLAEYAQAPVDSTVLLLVGGKMDRRRRLVAFAQKQGFLVSCGVLSGADLAGWISARARELGTPLAAGTPELLAELCGPELSPVADALERVSLFVGSGNTVTEDAIAECIVRVRPTTVWELVGAVGRRDVGAALEALNEVYDPHDRGLRLVGVLAWSARQLLKFESAIRAGLPPAEAAARAGAPPFKARELSQQVRAIARADLERWPSVLAGVDRSLKGGSRRPPKAVLEAAVIELCRAGAPAPARAR